MISLIQFPTVQNFASWEAFEIVGSMCLILLTGLAAAFLGFFCAREFKGDKRNYTIYPSCEELAVNSDKLSLVCLCSQCDAAEIYDDLRMEIRSYKNHADIDLYHSGH